MKSKKHTTKYRQRKVQEKNYRVDKNEDKPRGINQEHKDQTRTGGTGTGAQVTFVRKQDDNRTAAKVRTDKPTKSEGT